MINIKEIKKQSKAKKNNTLVKKETAMAIPPKATMPNVMPMTKNRIASSNNMAFP